MPLKHNLVRIGRDTRGLEDQGNLEEAIEAYKKALAINPDFECGKINKGDALKEQSVEVTGCWHPSPASPLANRNGGADWRENVSSVLP